MSDVTVFVDDAVQGRLPMVCVRTGDPADGLYRIHSTVGGMSSWAFLLIFFGPIGWLALLIAFVVGGRGRSLMVRLPYTRDAVADEQDRLRAAIVAAVVLVVLSAVAITLGIAQSSDRTTQTLLWLSVVGAIVVGVATFVLALRYTSTRPSLELDASGRWVTVGRVDPAFAAAVEQRRTVELRT